MIIPSNTRVPILSEEGVSKTYKILYLWVSNPIFVCVLYYYIILYKLSHKMAGRCICDSFNNFARAVRSSKSCLNVPLRPNQHIV